MKSKILWVDDTFVNELHDVMAYEDELTYIGGYDVVKKYRVDDALDILETGEEEFSCIILDIMMPYGKRLKAGETEAGTKTGIVLAVRIRQMDKYKKVPIVLHTGVRSIYESLIEIKNNIFPCLLKAEISAEDFLKEIQNAIENSVGGKS